MDKAFAQNINISTHGINTPTPSVFNANFTTIYQLVFTLLATAAFLSIVYAGYLMITSGGDAAKFAQGKKSLIFSMIGIVVISLAFFVIKFVESLARMV